MAAKDHTVPRMYLKRFADDRKVITTRRISDMGNPFTPNISGVGAINAFYWGIGPDGVEGHNMEGLLTMLEGSAAPVFASLLDNKYSAQPKRWALPTDEKIELSWWIAAQLLRTTRQRKRLSHLHGKPPLEKGRARDFSSSNIHLQYMYEQMKALAFMVFDRPWGFGYSDVCLITSDSPVVIMNGHDDEDQLKAFADNDVVLPLDPHRLLLLPGPDSIDIQRKEIDHIFKLDGGTGSRQSGYFDAADQFIFHHSGHDLGYHE
jgi:hypothetical protein